MEVQRSHNLVCSTYRNLGLLINKKKSTLTPVQQTEFIGAILDSMRARAFLLEVRFQAVSDLKNHPLTTAHTCLLLLGHMAECTYVVSHAHLHLWLL